MPTASTPITGLELTTLFSEFASDVTDAEQWLDVCDAARDWTDARVRRGTFTSLMAAGCAKTLDHHAGVHTFTFADGSTLNVSRHGVQF